jgi:hypothetical protein
MGQHLFPDGQQPLRPVPSGQQLNRESQQEDSDPAGQTFWFGAQRHVPLLEQIWVLVQVPQEPPQPSVPHVLPAHFGLHFFFFFFFFFLASPLETSAAASPRAAAVAAPHWLRLRRERRSVNALVR